MQAVAVFPSLLRVFSYRRNNRQTKMPHLRDSGIFDVGKL